MRLAFLVAITALLVVACAAPSSTGPPSVTPGPTTNPTATSSPVETPAPTPTLSPSSATTPTPAPTQPGPTLSPSDSGWNFVGNDAFGDVARFSSAATNGATTVVAGEQVIAPAQALTGLARTRIEVELWTTWSTTDGLVWRTTDFWAGLESRDFMEIGVVALGQGFAAYARSTENESGVPTTSFFLSVDGHDWQQTSQLESYEVTALASTGQALVALAVDFDGRGTIWLSSDGATWRQSADADAPLIATGGKSLIAYDDNVAALSATADGFEVWMTTDGDSWERAARLPGSPRGNSDALVGAAMAAGAAGWSVLAMTSDESVRRFAWHSIDGLDWQAVASPPDDIDYPALIAFDGGFVATDFVVDAPCCIYEPHDIKGVTWSSPDGITWTESAGRGWKARRVEVLVMRLETLIGLGIDWSTIPAGDVTGAGHGAQWIADPWTFVS